MSNGLLKHRILIGVKPVPALVVPDTYLLLEDGDKILLEDGDKILTEDN